MPNKRGTIRNVVILRAYDSQGHLVQQLQPSYDDFYEGCVGLIDDSSVRARRGIRSIRGQIYNSCGELQQTFENQYDETGKYVHGRAAHQNGTITED